MKKLFSIILLIAAVHLTSVAVTNDNDEPRLTTAEVFNADSIRACRANMAKDLADMGITEALDSNFHYFEYLTNLTPSQSRELDEKFSRCIQEVKARNPEVWEDDKKDSTSAKLASLQDNEYQKYYTEFSPKFAEFIKKEIWPKEGLQLITPENTKIPDDLTNRELRELQRIITQNNGFVLFIGPLD